MFQHVSKTKAISKTHTEVCWGDFSSHRDLQKHFCPTFVPSDWQPVHVEHFCVWNRTCTSVVQVVVEVVDFPHMSLVQIVQSPLLRTQIKRRSPNETQMWNVCGQLDLRQPRLRGHLFPESHNIHRTISITPLGLSQPSAPGWFWKESMSTLSMFTSRNQLLLEAMSETTTRENKDLQREFLLNTFLMKTV